MTGTEKVIECFEKLREYADSEVHPVVSPDNWNIYSELRDLIDKAEKDTLALLKAQEPVVPIIETYWETPSVYDNDVKVTENKCGACGAEIDKWDKYCRVCGRAVKWDIGCGDGGGEA